MKIARTATSLALVAATVAATPATALAAQFEGRIVSVNRAAKTFRIHDAERGTKRIKVTRVTRFHRLAGFSALHAGMRRIEVAGIARLRVGTHQHRNSLPLRQCGVPGGSQGIAVFPIEMMIPDRETFRIPLKALR